MFRELTENEIPNIAVGKDEYFHASVSYPLDKYEWSGPDEEIESIAKQFRGQETGAGTGFGERDISFTFRTLIEALAFFDAVKKRFRHAEPSKVITFWRGDDVGDIDV